MMKWYRVCYFEVIVHQILITLFVFKYCSDMTLFLANSAYRFHLIGLKVDGQLLFEAVQHVLFCGFSTPNFDSYPYF